MKKIFLIMLFFLQISCANETIKNDCFSGINVNENLNLNNPEFIDLKVNVGKTITKLPQSNRKIIIIKNSETNFKVFDLECPSKDCNTSMTFDGLKLKCPCDGKEYNSLNGSPINGEGCFALEYNVRQTGSSILQIMR